jgi:hypothetical protein
LNPKYHKYSSLKYKKVITSINIVLEIKSLQPNSQNTFHLPLLLASAPLHQHHDLNTWFFITFPLSKEWFFNSIARTATLSTNKAHIYNQTTLTHYNLPQLATNYGHNPWKSPYLLPEASSLYQRPMILISRRTRQRTRSRGVRVCIM